LLVGQKGKGGKLQTGNRKNSGGGEKVGKKRLGLGKKGSKKIPKSCGKTY